MRRFFTALPIVATLLALVLSLPALGLHGAAHEKAEAHHNHHAPAHPIRQDLSQDDDDIACETLCTGPLLTVAVDTPHTATAHAAQPRPRASRLWADWACPVSPPPKHPA
ncbi:MAG: hypothetical protein H5U15_02530 [Roseovarius sp.]|nr:hypothetical protein [Roseovarius sp.]